METYKALPDSAPHHNLVESWNRKARGSGIPPVFADAHAEASFLHEYRLAGLRSVTFACALGIAAYVAIGVVDIAFGGWNPEGTMRRIIAVALLLATVAIIVAEPYRVLKNYSLLLGTLGCVTIVGLVSVIHLLRDEDVSALVNPVSLLALWILYGFVRLPIRVAILVGTVGSSFSMFGSRLTNMEEPGTRTLIYLVMGNALGMLLARSIEVRERQLFLQRRMAESAQAELLRRTSDAENASAEKTRLITAVGHDLRQPMLSAVLHAGVLLQRLRAGDFAGVARQADRVEQSVKILGDTLEHLLTAARYDAGTEPVRIEAVPLSNVFGQLRELYESEACSQRISLRIREPIIGLTVLTDERALLRVLMNLVANAIKFASPDANERAGVVVGASLRDGICRIAVIDNGIGIAEGHLAGIWQPFFQIDNQERNRAKGLGLGLYLVGRAIASLKKHSVSVRSTLGRGTRFEVSLPGVRAAASRGASEKPTKVGNGDEGTLVNTLEGLSVLLLEDDQEARAALEAQLSEWGIVWSSGSTVEQVMKAWAVSRRRVDRIIADFRLPGQPNGAGAIREVRNLLGYEPSAILITAEVNRAYILSIMPPSTEFIQKPFDAGVLRKGLEA